jgi:SRSO17 transposase
LLSPLATRNGWTVAQAAGERSPDGMQRLLNQAVWDEGAVREDLRGYVVEHLGAADGVLVFDETGDIKKGNHTVGVARQYTGVTGQVENCQISVHAAYVSARGQALVDTELYLPKAFALDPARCAEAGVPPERAGRVITKGELAVTMFHRAVAAAMPFGYVAGDEVYGRSATLRAAVEQAGYGYVLEVGCDFPLRLPAATSRCDFPLRLPAATSRCVARSPTPPGPTHSSVRFRAGAGSTGPRARARRGCAPTPGPGSPWTRPAAPTAGCAAC